MVVERLPVVEPVETGPAMVVEPVETGPAMVVEPVETNRLGLALVAPGMMERCTVAG